MKTVAVIDRVTLDCIYADFPRYPEKGEELLAGTFSLTLGGGACVVPVRLSKMGVPARFGTFLGNDLLSDTARRLLSDFGVANVHNFYTGDKSPVIYSTVFTTPDDRGILSYDAGVNEIPEDELYEFFKGADICFAPKNEAVVKRLKSDGAVLLYDSHWEEGQSLADYIPIIKHADFFTPNDKEAMALTGTDTAEDALTALSEYTKCPIVKVGKRGCIAKLGGEIKSFPAYPAKTVDTTGAGDNFLTGLAFGICHGFSAERCIRLANFAGAKSTEAHGCYAAEYDLNKYSEE